MKKLKNTIRFVAALLLGASLTLMTACNNEPEQQSPTSEGVIFDFSMRTIYGLGSMTELKSVKITLSQNGAKFDLPSMRLSGNDQLVSTEAYRLSPGAYNFVSYIGYNATADQILKVEVDDNNLIEVKTGELTRFDLPINVRVVEFPTDYYRNALYGLCVELFGKDNEEAWPWDFTKKDLRDMQKRHTESQYLEFEVDDYENILYLAGIALSGPDFESVTEFPAHTLENLKTVESLTLYDMPNLRKINGLGTLSHLGGLTIAKTALEEIPEEIGNCKQLNALAVIDGRISKLPAALQSLEELYMLHLSGNALTVFETTLSGMKNLSDVNLSHNPITTIGENVFSETQKINNLDLSYTQLSTLPSVIARMSLLRGVNLSGCRFTSVPAAVKGNLNLRTIHLSGNPIASIPANEFSAMANLQGLYLSDIAFNTTPALNSASLIELGMNNCSLTTAPDVSKLPELRRLDLNGNKIASGEFDFSVNNPKMRILSLNSSTTTTLPAITVKLKDGKAEAFSLLDVSDCPSLHFTTPAAWQSYDVAKPKPIVSDKQGPLEDIYGPATGRVGVCREGSPNVSFGTN